MDNQKDSKSNTKIRFVHTKKQLVHHFYNWLVLHQKQGQRQSKPPVQLVVLIISQ